MEKINKLLHKLSSHILIVVKYLF